MGQKTHPIGFRLSVKKNWRSNWYADKSFAAELEEDIKIRKYIQHRMPNAGISRVDISRTWWVGDEAPRPNMVETMKHGYEHMMTNMSLLAPCVSFNDLVHKGHHLDEKYQRLKYGCKMHGVGLCDEWPLIAYPDQQIPGAFDYELEPGMVLCVEALVSSDKGDFSIKLEDQVFITEDGYENLTSYPFDERLMGQKT